MTEAEILVAWMMGQNDDARLAIVAELVGLGVPVGAVAAGMRALDAGLSAGDAADAVRRYESSGEIADALLGRLPRGVSLPS